MELGGGRVLLQIRARHPSKSDLIQTSLNSQNPNFLNNWETDMAKGEQKGNREQKKPKKEKIKVIAAAPSQKTAGWQPSFGSGKKK